MHTVPATHPPRCYYRYICTYIVFYKYIPYIQVWYTKIYKYSYRQTYTARQQVENQECRIEIDVGIYVRYCAIRCTYAEKRSTVRLEILYGTSSLNLKQSICPTKEQGERENLLCERWYTISGCGNLGGNKRLNQVFRSCCFQQICVLFI